MGPNVLGFARTFLLPNSETSLMLSSTPFRTLLSQTPSQFHSPGFRPGDSGILPESALTGLIDLEPNFGRPRWSRQACQALVFTEADNGSASRKEASSNAFL